MLGVSQTASQLSRWRIFQEVTYYIIMCKSSELGIPFKFRTLNNMFHFYPLSSNRSKKQITTCAYQQHAKHW